MIFVMGGKKKADNLKLYNLTISCMWKQLQPVAFDGAQYGSAVEFIGIGSSYIDPGLQILSVRAQTELLHVPSSGCGHLLA